MLNMTYVGIISKIFQSNFKMFSIISIIFLENWLLKSIFNNVRWWVVHKIKWGLHQFVRFKSERLYQNMFKSTKIDILYASSLNFKDIYCYFHFIAMRLNSSSSCFVSETDECIRFHKNRFSRNVWKHLHKIWTNMETKLNENV